MYIPPAQCVLDEDTQGFLSYHYIHLYSHCSQSQPRRHRARQDPGKQKWSARLRTTKGDRQSGGLQGVAESVLERMSPERGKELTRMGDRSFGANTMSTQGLWLIEFLHQE